MPGCWEAIVFDVYYLVSRLPGENLHLLIITWNGCGLHFSTSRSRGGIVCRGHPAICYCLSLLVCLADGEGAQAANWLTVTTMVTMVAMMMMMMMVVAGYGPQ